MADLELVQGTLDFLVLRTLNWGPQHGFGVAKWIRGVTGERLRVADGAAHPRAARRGREVAPGARRRAAPDRGRGALPRAASHGAEGVDLLDLGDHREPAQGEGLC